MTERLPLRSAKMTTQRLPSHVVARPRLMSMLANDDWRIATIVAGPGAGKSVVAAQFLAASVDCGAALFQADHGDDGFERFWTYVVAALQRSQPGAFDASERLLTSRTGRTELFVSQLLDDAERLDRPMLLVIEDLHTIRDRSILSALDEVIEYLPRQVRLVVTSRRDVDLRVSRWRARSWLVEIRQEELAFDQRETRQLLGVLGVDGLADEEIESLRTQTDGLVAALQLAVLAARTDDMHAVIRDFAAKHRIVADFIGSEIIEKQTPDVREFMVRTSILETLDAELCDALCRRSDSDAQLQALEADTHFLTALRDDRSSYRYHPLLRDVLRIELERRDPCDVHGLHLVAAEVLERRGQSLAAARHLMAVDEYDRAFELLFARIGRGWKHGDIDAATVWLDAVPLELVEHDAHRMLLYGLALCMCWRLDEAFAWLSRGRAALSAATDASDDDIALADTLALVLFALGGVEEDVARGRRAVDRSRSMPGPALVRRAVPTTLARACLLADERVEVDGSTWDDRNVESIGDGVVSLGVSARIALRLGQLAEAADCAGRALAAAQAFDTPEQLATVDARLAQLGVAIERDELASTPAMLEVLHQICERVPAFSFRLLVALDEVRIVRARSGLDDALAATAELRVWFDERSRPTLQRRVDALEAQLLIDAGELDRAEALLARLPERHSTRGLLAVRLLLARGEATAARQALRGVHRGNLREALHAAILDARAALLLGEDVDVPVHRIVDLAAPERHVRVLREEDEALLRLVRRTAGDSATFGAERLAAALGAPPRRRQPVAVAVTLSDRERDVLRFLPTRLTNAEIASECLMSVNTVKAHLKKIYSKLAVTTRAQAVERARMLGELPSPALGRAAALDQTELSGARP